MRISLLHLIIDHLFGHRYYVNIYNRRGTAQICISANLHYTLSAAKAEAAQPNASFLFIETVSFRSHKNYAQ